MCRTRWWAITLANDGLPLRDCGIDEFGQKDSSPLTSFPAVKTGRLAISEYLQRSGVGRQVMGLVHGEVLSSPTLSAALLLALSEDYDPAVLAFRQLLGSVKPKSNFSLAFSSIEKNNSTHLSARTW